MTSYQRLKRQLDAAERLTARMRRDCLEMALELRAIEDSANGRSHVLARLVDHEVLLTAQRYLGKVKREPEQRRLRGIG